MNARQIFDVIYNELSSFQENSIQQTLEKTRNYEQQNTNTMFLSTTWHLKATFPKVKSSETLIAWLVGPFKHKVEACAQPSKRELFSVLKNTILKTLLESSYFTTLQKNQVNDHWQELLLTPTLDTTIPLEATPPTTPVLQRF